MRNHKQMSLDVEQLKQTGKDIESGQAAPSWSTPPSQKSHQGMEKSLERKKFLMSRSYDKV